MSDADPLRSAQDDLFSKVDKNGFGIIKKLVRNSRFFYEPVPRGPEFPARSKKKTLRIATVANRVHVESPAVSGNADYEKFKPKQHLNKIQKQTDHPRAKQFEDLTEANFTGIKMVVFRKGFDFAAYRNEYLEHLKRAVDDGADAICFGELAYPHPGNHLDEYDAHDAFEAELQRYADDHRIVIIGGSFHRLTTQSNECRLFLPRDKDRNGKIKKRASEQSPRFYTKRVAATKIGEVVRKPPYIDFPYYRAPFGKFGTLICLDSFDPTLFLRFFSWHAYGLKPGQGKAEDLNVIFIPSYSENYRGAVMAQHLSFMTQAIVVYVDTTICSPHSQIYINGQKSDNVPCVSVIGDAAPNSDLYCLREIDLSAYEEARQDHSERLRDSNLYKLFSNDPDAFPEPNY